MTLIKDVMNKRLATVGKEADMRQICRILTKRKLSGVSVVDKNGTLLGYVSERDIIRAVTKAHFYTMKAHDIMTKKVQTVEPDDPLTNASKIFALKEYRLMPVVKNGKVVGMISRKDIIETMLEDYY